MAKYLARQIKEGKLNYDDVIAKYPQYKEAIDEILGINDAAEETDEQNSNL